jgi:H+/Cl- antiporter ClcA
MIQNKPHNPPEGHSSLLVLALLALVVGAAAGLVGAIFRLTLEQADRLRDALIAWTQGEKLAGFSFVGCCLRPVRVLALPPRSTHRCSLPVGIPWPRHSAEGFAVVGMAAFFTGVVRAPLTGIVLVTEMTVNVTMLLLLPMLVACFAAMLVPTLLRDAPIYDSLREHTLRRERALQTESAGRKMRR